MLIIDFQKKNGDGDDVVDDGNEDIYEDDDDSDDDADDKEKALSPVFLVEH